MDATGHRSDSASGFVIAPNLVATAFQAIDSAAKLEVEFSNGRKLTISEVRAWSRSADWALLNVSTGSAPPIPRGNPQRISIGERLIVFNVESSGRVIGGVDISGRRTIPGFGERIQISPEVATEAVGGPLLDLSGHVVGVLGGSSNPAARVPASSLMMNYAVWRSFQLANAATPITSLSDNAPSGDKTLQDLAADGTMTTPLVPMHELLYGGTSNEMPKNIGGLTPRDVTDFTTRDAQIWVFTMWAKKGKISKGEVSAKVYDPSNQVRVTIAPKKIGLQEVQERLAFSFPPTTLKPGIYRIDILWDGQAVWRTFVRIQD